MAKKQEKTVKWGYREITITTEDSLDWKGRLLPSRMLHVADLRDVYRAYLCTQSQEIESYGDPRATIQGAINSLRNILLGDIKRARAQCEKLSKVLK